MPKLQRPWYWLGFVQDTLCAYPCFVGEILQAASLIIQTLLVQDCLNLGADGFRFSRWEDILDLKVQSVPDSCAVLGN